MSQIQDLTDNIDELTEVIHKLNETVKPLDITIHLMTKRQIAKKMMSVALPDSPPDRIHFIVYGKELRGANGKLIDDEKKYPECVDHKRAIKFTHSIFKEIDKMIKDVKNSIRSLNNKLTTLKSEFVLAGKQIGFGVATISAAPTLLPPGTGLPVGINAAQSIIATINNLSAKVMEIIPILGPLINIPLLIIETAINIVLAAVNAILVALILVIGTIAELRKMILPVIKALQKVGGA